VGGEYVHEDALVGIISNRNTGYRWILRREDWGRVEFQTPAMLEEVVADQGIDVHLDISEAEALARAAKSAIITDKRERTLVAQALDQVALLCRQVRERVRLGDSLIDTCTSSIPRSISAQKTHESSEESEKRPAPRPRYRPLGDPDHLSLKEVGEILGEARNTLYLWYRNGKLPPAAVDIALHLGGHSKPVVVVPR
jgi:hypothetical protein